MVAKSKIKMRILILVGVGLFFNQKAMASGSKYCCRPDKCTPQECQDQPPVQTSANYKMVTLSNTDLLNLKNEINPSKNGRISTSSAISIEYSDFEVISSPGKSWLTFLDADASFTMNIGNANNSTPQNWSLPSDLLSYYDGAYQDDFVLPASLPNNLRLAGANKIVKGYYVDENNHPVDIYSHYLLNSSTIQRIGTTYDYDFEIDDIFDEPDFEFAKVPLRLNDSFRSVIETTDTKTNQKLNKTVENITVDGFGSISTPLGTSQCLRLKFVDSTFTRNNESQPYAFSNTFTSIGFATKGGEYFYANTNTTTGVAMLTKPVYKLVVNTSSLTQAGSVMLNNNNRGISINVDDEDPHPSAILDIKNDSLGLLIPRISSANRPNLPAEGLLVYQVDNTPGFYYFDGIDWQMLSATTPTASIASQNARKGVSNVASMKGSNQLENGSAFVKFEQPVDNFEDLFIKVQLEGDCNGVYISKKSREGFEIKELKKGKSNVRFIWSVE
jgi:hypothetical protein